MQGINPMHVPALVCRDVERVEQDARFIIIVDENRIVATLRNPHGRLSVIAVIGPGEIHENIPSPLRKFAEAVLLEVGVSRGRPYREAFGTENQRYIPKRRPWFSLIDAQYLAVAPYIFHLLQMLTDKRTSRWKCGTNTKPVYLPTPNDFFFRKKKKIESSISPKGWVNGARFSAPLSETLLLADIYCAELTNKTVQRDVAGLGGYLDLLLSRYQAKGWAWPFWKLKYARIAAEKLRERRLPRHLKIEVLRYVRSPYLRTHLGSVIEWDGVSETPQRLLARRALPNVKWRLGELQLRTVKESTPFGYLVFEVYPSPHI